jgi:hypothetical protein
MARIIIKGGAKLGAFKMPNNKKRAMWGKAALHFHSKLVGDLGEPLHTQFVDILGDLLHAARASSSVDFESALDTAKMHYDAELREATDRLNPLVCADCGERGVRTGHMTCQYPQDRP